MSISSDRLLQLKEFDGDLFDAPKGSILLHACNCKGSWGAGIAAVFKRRYPSAFEAYKEHCYKFKDSSLAGTAYLIAPSANETSQHYIGCLFTSKSCGKAKDSPLTILSYTRSAMEDMVDKIAAERKNDVRIGEIRMCRINSGYFGVPWERTKSVLEGIESTDGTVVEIFIARKD